MKNSFRIDPQDVTIIIPHLGRNEKQEKAFDLCYSSLLRNSPLGMKMKVVKNGNKACPHIRDIRIIEQGQCKSVNAAVAITNTPWIFITNDDMVYGPGWYEKLMEGLDPGYDLCVSPTLIEPNPGAPTFEVKYFGTLETEFNQKAWDEFSKKREDKRIVSGFNLPLLIKRDLWNTVGGYDIAYDPFSSNSDSDLEYKIKLAGIQPLQNKNCVVYHFSQTSGTFEPQNQGYWQKNWEYFKEKWGFYRTDDGIWQASFDIPTRLEGRKFLPEWEEKYE